MFRFKKIQVWEKIKNKITVHKSKKAKTRYITARKQVIHLRQDLSLIWGNVLSIGK